MGAADHTMRQRVWLARGLMAVALRFSFLLLFLVALGNRNVDCAGVPVPDAVTLAWTRREIGAFFSFNIITMLTNVTNTGIFCIGVAGGGGFLPSPDAFNPEKLDLDNWMQAAVAMGAKYAVLTAQHCSGFSMWPTDVYQETGFEYTFSTRYSSFRGGGYDVVDEFVSKCKKHGIQPGLYYSLNQNYYLNVGGGFILNTSLVPGQANVSQSLYGKIVLAQMKELLTNYGPVTEIWFDGGCSVPGIVDKVEEILAHLQPDAMIFNCDTCSKHNKIRWIGTESGLPNYPIWSTSQHCSSGQGGPGENSFCPAESDTTLQQFDRWFWRPNFPIRSLDELKSVYYHTVGQNTNLLLNAAANSSGLIESASMKRYQEFGDWISKCFKNPVLSTSGKGYTFALESSGSAAPLQFNQILVSEDQSQGQFITGFTVSAQLTNGSTAALVPDGQSVGNKFIRAVSSTLSSKVTLEITNSLFEPTILQFSIYNC